MSEPREGITRRQLAAAAVTTPLLAQTPAASAESELEAARDEMKQVGVRLRKETVPTMLEPSVVFRP